jgi:aspartate/methionine/tyrosine aminotransferase
MSAQSKVERQEAALREEAPAAWACLNARGRRLAYPAGIPAQSTDAAGCTYNATIGQVTDGRGNPLPLPSLERHSGDLDNRDLFLYAKQGGAPELRRAWRGWQALEAGEVDLPLPMVTAGLTHGLSLVASLFVDEDTDVLIADPCWENYEGIFGDFFGGRLRGFDFFDADLRFNAAALREALAASAGRKAALLLNLPGNPSGYTLTRAEVPAMMEAILAHPGPLVVICDDAYHGMTYEDDLLTESPFWELARRGDPARLLAVKIDGVTKELFFFGGRVGFVTFGVGGAAGAALEDKARASARFTVSSMPGPSQAIAAAALSDLPQLRAEQAAVMATLTERYAAMKQALGALEGTALTPYPFNSGCFCLVGVDPAIDADALRRRLIAEQSVGVVAVPSINAVRLAFCSMALEDIPEVVRRLAAAVATG